MNPPAALPHLQEEYSERRGSVLRNSDSPKAKAKEEVINHLDEG
jgi:hypothetical protein